MTLGGLALAVGILVDDATVTIENINWHLEQGKEVEPAILDGAHQIVTPAFVSLLCICIVFVPMFFLNGVARFLFVPMAEAVVFAMICSFILSRTLVPTMANYLLQAASVPCRKTAPAPPRAIRWCAFQQRLRSRLRAYSRAAIATLLELAMGAGAVFIARLPGFRRRVVPADAVSRPRLLSRPSTPARSSCMSRLASARASRKAPSNSTRSRRRSARSSRRRNSTALVDNIGMPISGINLTYSNTGVIGTQDGDIQIKLAEDHRPTADYVRQLRDAAAAPVSRRRRSPSCRPTSSARSSISARRRRSTCRSRGANLAADFDYANLLLKRMRHIPGVADARIQQSPANPTLDVDVDRTRAQYVGLTERDVTNSLVVDLAGSGQVTPTYWLDPKSGVSYSIVMQTPQYQLDTLSDLETVPISAAGGAVSPILGGLAKITRRSATRSFPSTTSCRSCRSTRRRKDAISARSPTTSASCIARNRGKRAQGRRGGDAGTGADDEQRLFRPVVRLDRRDRADLSAHRGELPVLGRSVRDRFGAAGRSGGHRLDAVRQPHHPVRARPDRGDHVHGRRDGQQRAGDQLRPRTLCGARRPGRRRARRRLRAFPAGGDDRPGDDHRHGADGAGARRRRRAERPAGARRRSAA